MRKKEIIFVTGLTAMLAITGLYTVLTGNKEYSANENRYLTQFSTVNLSGILSGEMQQQMGNALEDQFPGRDFWTGLTTKVEKKLGYKDVGGVYLGKDSYYFEKVMNQDISQTNYFQNLRFVNHLVKISGEADVTAMLVPSPGTILSDKLPAHAVLYDAETMYEEAAQVLQDVKLIDLRQSLKQESEKSQVYYRTDHHWSLRGAYEGYSAYCQVEGGTPKNYEAFDVHTVSEDFYGTLYSKALDDDAVPDMMDAAQGLPDVEVICDGKERSGVYDTTKVEQKDKYAYYFGGNYGEVTISHVNNDSSAGKKLLVIKDSFANSMIPFLLEEYDEIRMLDLRYFKNSMERYVEEYGADEVLVLYELSNFAKDQHMNRLMK